MGVYGFWILSREYLLTKYEPEFYFRVIRSFRGSQSVSESKPVNDYNYSDLFNSGDRFLEISLK